MNHAMNLAQVGKLVFPCGPDKRPMVKWSEAATCDPDQIAEWWTRWPSAMIGLPCGAANNLFVIDLDTDKATGEALGEASLVALGYGALLDGPRVQTPSGGLHLYFRHWSGGRNGVARLGPCVDTRAEGGYIIASGSQSRAGRYQGAIPWDALPKVPLGLRALATRPQAVAQRRDIDPASQGEVAELLAHVPPDSDYETWLTVLMALHDRFGGSDEGFALADQWSAQGAKYRPGEVAQKWRSFKGSGVSFASLPAIARDHGADLSAIARNHMGGAHG